MIKPVSAFSGWLQVNNWQGCSTITNKYFPLYLKQLCSYFKFFPLAALLLGACILGAITSFSDPLCTLETTAAAAASLRARPDLAVTGIGIGTFSSPFTRTRSAVFGALPQRRADADKHTSFASSGHDRDAIRSCARSPGTRSVGRPPASPGSAQGTSTCALVLRLRSSSSFSLPTPCSAPDGRILRGGILR